MASSCAAKRLVSGSLFSRSLRALRSAAPAASSRLFNINAVALCYEDSDDDDDVDRRSGRPLYHRRDFRPFTGVDDGPWSIVNVLIVLKQWKPNGKTGENEVFAVHLSFEFCCIACCIGKQ